MAECPSMWFYAQHRKGLVSPLPLFLSIPPTTSLSTMSPSAHSPNIERDTEYTTLCVLDNIKTATHCISHATTQWYVNIEDLRVSVPKVLTLSLY